MMMMSKMKIIIILIFLTFKGECNVISESTTATHTTDITGNLLNSTANYTSNDGAYTFVPKNYPSEDATTTNGYPVVNVTWYAGNQPIGNGTNNSANLSDAYTLVPKSDNEEDTTPDSSTDGDDNNAQVADDTGDDFAFEPKNDNAPQQTTFYVDASTTYNGTADANNTGNATVGYAVTLQPKWGKDPQPTTSRVDASTTFNGTENVNGTWNATVGYSVTLQPKGKRGIDPQPTTSYVDVSTTFNGTENVNGTWNATAGYAVTLQPKWGGHDVDENSWLTTTTGLLDCNVTVHANGTNTTVCRNDSATQQVTTPLIPKQANDHTMKAPSKLTVTKQNSISKNKPKQVGNFSSGGLILGIGSIFDDTYVLQENSTTIRVFDQSFEAKLSLSINKLTNPIDMVCLAFLENLFVLDASDVPFILRIRSDRRFDSTRWVFSDSFTPSALSLTPDKYVLVTDQASSKLREFLPNGVQVKTTTLATSTPPLHAVKMDQKTYVASFGKTQNDVHQVCLFDFDGKQIGTCYGGTVGSGDGQLSTPIRLMVTDQSTILVADSDNGRIIELDSKLNYVKTLLSVDDGLSRPNRIVLDRWRSLLLIGDSDLEKGFPNRGKVLAYKI